MSGPGPGRITVIGLGPADAGLLTVAAERAIAATPRRYVRTTRHPSAHVVLPATSFDDLYERAASIDDVYRGIVDTLVDAAGAGDVLYAVPGSPLVAERTVELLRADGRVKVEIQPAMSFLDVAWARLGVDPVASGARLVDGHRFALEAAGERGPLLVAQCDTSLVLSDIKLALSEIGGGADDLEVVVLQRLGLPDESVTTLGWADLDREVEPDHLTSVWIPALAAPVAGEVTRFAELVRTLRERCPWDREQTHRSLTRHLLEETYEVIEAIDELERDGDSDHLEEELGDLLFQVVFHATLAAEEGYFTLADVARGVHDKLVRRHPHVFEGAEVGSWEQLKAAEKGRSSVMEGLPENLPSLLYAHKVQWKAASLGFDWENAAGAWRKVGEELSELRAAVTASPGDQRAVQEELGDVLFAVVNVARHLDVDPETALRDAAAKFRRRFAHIEAQAAGAQLSLGEWDALWEGAKSLGL
ncbi:nucleoside triphosphate pyrophosphohydrolase [Acidiferrimicrobium sp. IK]|uniref:nucleoside triphosphate pyrophosphohydrolase n=1 Tax=Acidiferrimicrobium sp. IK TaxID=2871700 RepID=UPI0021CB406C|nr:nucleoside triphosphate pyrophosphohydrolase [Acidiferrimicrobium sp. IK]MCU4187079.1 nucleoside triphosphate pyrophosphohydrolase [Acidiferrimicrobium sp. IK]